MKIKLTGATTYATLTKVFHSEDWYEVTQELGDRLLQSGLFTVEGSDSEPVKKVMVLSKGAKAEAPTSSPRKGTVEL